MSKKVLLFLVMALAVAGFVVAVQGGEDGEGQKKIHVRSIIADCDGDDCAEHHGRRAIFIGDDGETTILGGHGAMHWNHHGGGYLGVGLTELSPELREHFGLSPDAGVMVSKVVAGGPAAEAGIEVGDIITGIDGESVKSSSSLAMKVGALDENEAAAIELWREGRLQTVSARVEHRAGPKAQRFAFRCEDGDCDSIHSGHSGDANALFVHCDGDDCDRVEKRVVRIECDGEDCPEPGNLDFDFDCGEENCQVQVECNNDGCNCTVNGEAADCTAFGH